MERKNRPEDFNPVKFNYKIYRASLECLSYKGENTPVDWIGLITILELFSNFNDIESLEIQGDEGKFRSNVSSIA